MIVNFSVNSARALFHKNVNLHLKDGSVIINIQITALIKTDQGTLLKCVSGRRQGDDPIQVPLRNVAWAEQLNKIIIDEAKATENNSRGD